MKFQRYLNESVITQSGIDGAGRLIALEFSQEKKIYTDAMNFLIANQNKIKPILDFLKYEDDRVFLWRAIQKNETGGNMFGSLNVRKNRIPLTTTKSIHKLMDEYLYDIVKWKPRSEGIFASFDQNSASGYGHTYMVFPVGKLQYMYSPELADSFRYLSAGTISRGLWEEDDEKYNRDLTKANDLIIKDRIPKDMENDIKKWWSKVYDIETTKLESQIGLQTEIIFNCDEYLYFDEEMFNIIRRLVYEI